MGSFYEDPTIVMEEFRFRYIGKGCKCADYYSLVCDPDGTKMRDIFNINYRFRVMGENVSFECEKEIRSACIEFCLAIILFEDCAGFVNGLRIEMDKGFHRTPPLSFFWGIFPNAFNTLSGVRGYSWSQTLIAFDAAISTADGPGEVAISPAPMA